MKNAYLKQLFVFIYIINLFNLSACAKELPKNFEEAAKKQAAKEMKENPNTSVTFGSQDVSGYTIYYYKSGPCQRPGIDCPEKSYYFRESHGYVVTDNHYYEATTYDRISDEEIKRIDFSATILDVDASGNKILNNTAEKFSYSNAQPQSVKYDRLSDYYPQLSTGMAEAAVDIKKNVEASVQLHRLAQQQEQSFYNDLFKKHYENLGQIYADRSVLELQLRHLLKESLRSINPDSMYSDKDLISTINDPTTYREYEFDENTNLELKNQTAEFISKIQFTKLISAVEAGIYQKDKIASKKYQKYFSKYVRDGLIQYSQLDFPIAKPFESFKYETPLESRAGQAVRRLANQINQTIVERLTNSNPSTQLVSALMTASAMLQTADHYLVSNEDARGYEMLTLAESVYAATKGIVRGIGQTVVVNGKLLPDLALLVHNSTRAFLNDPKAAVNQLKQIYQSLPGFLPAVAAGLRSYYQEFLDGGVETKARIITRIGTEAFLILATSGTKAAVSATERVALLKSAEIVELKKLVKLKPDVVNSMIQLSAKQIEVLQVMSSGNRIEALGSVLKEYPLRAMDIERALIVSAESGDINAANYVMKLVQSPKLPYHSVDNIYTDIANEYVQLSKKAESVPLTKFDGTVTRAIPREVTVGETVIQNSIDDVFKEHSGMKTGYGRFSHGGAEGNSVMYTTIGNSEVVRDTVLSETGLNVSLSPIISSKELSFNRVWDLTDQNTLSSLGLDTKQLIKNSKEDVDAYIKSNILSDIAKNNGIEAIISHSAVDQQGLIKNLIIFNGVK